MSFNPDEVRFLAARADEIAAVTEDLELTKKSLFADHRVLADHFGEHARAVMELATARRLAAGKFSADWLTDVDAAQQATPALVASLRAERVKRCGAELVHDVTCSVGTEAPAFAGLPWVGSDLDFSRLLMARHNLGPGAWLARADALAPVAPGAVIIADPARRSGGRRITDPAKLHPPLPALLQAHAGSEMAVKCAPGIDYSEWNGLVSVVSVDGGVKEACLYTPGLAEGTSREAVVLRSDGFTETVASTDPDEAEVASPGAYIVEPDGAVVRAGLVRGWAARHGLWMLDEHIAFLTGSSIPAGYSGFPFIEAVPLRKLKAALAAHGAGPLEILVRGVDVDPDQLRAKLKQRGSRPMGVVIARVGDSAVAHICGAREWS
ncbi:THUMP-like domain-containing protein [Corynebacterium qintianiae]|uniref:THUMP-like domain-containing protein n=1 Tax=Corynebacterium qintianiae TaxID=2709392 RepID=UPI0013EDDCA9|nr:SAM-dependent methyltransferase [Corynebacterium qintianiae]